ncbi:MAG TPA: acetate--CoA ligase family protein [Candidatus Krumholzibacterium sp.]|nr:acetate--CoA ligase family protein [Candidatus Krumholzibacterium sp.]
MLKKEIKEILEGSKKTGWVLEPDAKMIMRLAGLDVPEYVHARTIEEAVSFAASKGYPLVAKVVSPDILHKSDVGGVVVGIRDEEELKKTFEGFSRMNGFVGAVVEEMASGVELIIGAKIDPQFGPVVLTGIGGVGVEIYKDTAIRMAPLKADDIPPMIADIRARKLLEGYRGADPVDMGVLSAAIVAFSELVMELEPYIESIDLNPVMCSASRCVVADARIILKGTAPGVPS